MAGATHLDALELARALRRGPATLDALAARLGGAERDALTWALDDAIQRGLVAGSTQPDCGPDGVCGDAPPTLVVLTDAGRTATAVAPDGTSS